MKQLRFVELFLSKYSQTWVNDHLRIATTFLQWPPFWSPILIFNYINDLWTTTTCLQRPLFWGLKRGCCTQVWLYVKAKYVFKSQLFITVNLFSIVPFVKTMIVQNRSVPLVNNYIIYLLYSIQQLLWFYLSSHCPNCCKCVKRLFSSRVLTFDNF